MKRAPRVLHLQLEFEDWATARGWSYASGLGMEEGFAASGVEWLTVTTPWLPRLRELCGDRQFDQVWFDIARSEVVDFALLEWLADTVPVRVGYMAESLEYEPEAWALNPEFRVRKQRAWSRLSYVTHVLGVDERDTEAIAASGVPALWWPQAVPRRVLAQPFTPRGCQPAVFAGAVYGQRGEWLERPDLKGLLARAVSGEHTSPYPLYFDALHVAVRHFLASGNATTETHLQDYLDHLRRIRRRGFDAWLDCLRGGSAVVNLPHLVRAYPSRIFEAMAAGRPVVSWRIPDRPRTERLFQEGEHILFFDHDDPASLAAILGKLRADEPYAARLAERAWNRVAVRHTVEQRVAEILSWIETGREPAHGL